MIFRTQDPYDLASYCQSNKDNKKPSKLVKLESNECFICLQEKQDDGGLSIRLNTQTSFAIFCDCDGWVHTQCLVKWYEINNNCPICRYKMSDKKKRLYNILVRRSIYWVVLILCLLYLYNSIYNSVYYRHQL